MWEFLSRSRSTDPLELMIHHRTGLRVLLERVRAAPTLPAPIDKRVEDLLGDTGRLTWDSLYEAEQRLIASMPDEEVEAEATRRFVEAEKFQVPSLPAIKEAYRAAQDGEPRKRAAQFRVLLDDLQWKYAKRRLDRATRTRAARALNVVGTLLVLLTIGFLAFLSQRSPTDVGALYQILTVVIFGLVGAFFSRMIAFHSQAETLDYDRIVSAFQMRYILIRLTIGIVGALIFYFLVGGGLVGGELFPKGGAASKGFEAPKGFDVQFAKLVFWSFLAGFSERLVPSTLERLDAQAQQAKTP